MYRSTEATRTISTLAVGFLIAAGSLAAQASRAPTDAQKRPAGTPAPAVRHESAGQEKREQGEAREARAANDDHERTLTAAQVPAPVRAAVTREFPHATVSKWTSEVENGKTMYEAETVDGTMHRDMVIGANGRISEVETVVTVAQLPAAVRTAATANNARVERAEMVVMGRDTTYEFKITGRAAELKLRANGTPVPAERH